MWIIESNGDFLEGKRMWLKPGKRYLFGRVKRDDVRHAVDHKTVSRKHFLVQTAEVKLEDVGKIHHRTKVTITDLNSKAGTQIDGTLIKGASVEPTGAVISIRPGVCPHELVMTWLPYVFTFGLTKKELRNGDLERKQEKVKDMDIKAVSEYLPGITTHLVVQKRNTPKGLQALIEGRPIVKEDYIDALHYFSAPSDINVPESLSPLETDIDANWPNPARYLPLPGKEPTNKPSDAYQPDPARAKVFDKYTFFIFDRSQYDTLLPPITTGHGKALFFEIVPRSTTLDDGLAFVRNAIGPRGHAIIIKLSDSVESHDWLDEYIDNLSSKLGQAPASQSDLLDSVLANDASQLCKPRAKPASPQESGSATRAASTRHDGQSSSMTHSSADAPTERASAPQGRDISAASSRPSPGLPLTSQPRPDTASSDQKEARRQSSSQDDNPRPPKRLRFVPSQRKVDPFDDDFNPDAIVAYEEEDEIAEGSGTESRSRHTERVQLASDNTLVKEEATPRHSRTKTSNADTMVDSEDEDLDKLLPAAAAMRREKQHQEAEAKRKGLPLKSALSVPRATPEVKPKKEVKMPDIRETARARKEAEDEAYRRERQELDEMLAEDEGKTGPANLVEIVPFELPVRKRGAEGNNNYRGQDWRPEWQGRKNFKGFRRARDKDIGGDAATSSRRARNKIIVPLVPPPEENQVILGLGRSTSSRNAQSSSLSKGHRSVFGMRNSQRSSAAHSEDSSSEVGSDNNEARQASPKTARLRKEAEGVLDHPVDVDAPRQTRHTDTQTSTTANSTASRNTQWAKRPASKPPFGRLTGSKKQKFQPISSEGDSDNDNDQSDGSEEVTFEFGRSKKYRIPKPGSAD